MRRRKTQTAKHIPGRYFTRPSEGDGGALRMKGVDSAHIRHLPPSPPPPPLTAMEKRLAAVTTPWPHVATLGVRFQRPIQQLYELYVLGCCFGIGTACIVPRSLPSHRSLPRTRFRCNSSINPKKKKKTFPHSSFIPHSSHSNSNNSIIALVVFTIFGKSRVGLLDGFDNWQRGFARLCESLRDFSII